MNELLVAVHNWGGPVLLPEVVDHALTLLTYILGVVAMVVFPRVRSRRGDRATLFLDLLIATGGLGLLQWTLITRPPIG